MKYKHVPLVPTDNSEYQKCYLVALFHSATLKTAHECVYLYLAIFNSALRRKLNAIGTT